MFVSGITVWLAGAIIFWLVEVLILVAGTPFSYDFKKFVLNGLSRYDAAKMTLLTTSIPEGFLFYIAGGFLGGILSFAAASVMGKSGREPKTVPLHAAAALGACLLVYAGIWLNIRFVPAFFSVKGIVSNVVLIGICAIVAAAAYRRYSAMTEGDAFAEFLAGAFVLNLFLMGEMSVLRNFALRPASVKGLVATAANTLVCGAVLVALKRFAGRNGGNAGRTISASVKPVLALTAILAVVSALAVGLSGTVFAGSGKGAGAKDKPNILFIVMDTARADRFSCYGYGRKTSPYIDRIAAEGAVFLNAISPSGWTLPAHVSMFTGLYPPEHGVGYAVPYLPEKIETITSVLKRTGYRTYGYSNNPWVSDFTGLSRSFDEFQLGWRKFDGRYFYKVAGDKIARIVRKDAPEYKLKDHGGAATTACVTGWIEKNGESPFFIFINYMEPHLPYYPVPPHDELFMPAEATKEERMRFNPDPEDPRTLMEPRERGKKERAVIDAFYDAEIHYLDDNIRRICEKLRERNLLENTMVVITSDHGDNLGEHGVIGHAYGLYNTLLYVPLIVRYPGLFPAGTVVPERVQTVDIYYTIRDAIGSEGVPSSLPLGKSLARRIREKIFEEMMIAGRDRPINNINWGKREGLRVDHMDKEERAVIVGDYKYVWTSKNEEMVYDLRTDRAESIDLAAKRPDLLSLLGGKLAKSFESAVAADPAAASGPKIDEETRQKLKSLGYVNK